ncbi:MAG: hypothetical protein ACLFWM_04715 [Actinomycetota bacterium]
MRPARLGAALLLVVLAGGVAIAATTMDDSEVPRVSATASRPRQSTTATSPAERITSPPASVPTTAASSTRLPDRSPERVVREGMEAWGRFAVAGDLGEVAPWFSPEGPQWRQFQAEAPALSDHPLGDPPYTVTVADLVLSREDPRTRVEATVTFVRTGEPSQTFRWVVVLVGEGEDRAIWTVEEAQAEASPPLAREIP